MDRLRVRALLRRWDAGEDELHAFWAVVSDPGIGLQRYRGATERPPELTLRRKLGALLERTAPGLVERARDVALSKLAAMSEDALCAVHEVVTGDLTDPGVARARLDAARTILGSLGISERATSAPVQAVQVNVGAGPSPYDVADAIDRDPELREKAIDLARALTQQEEDHDTS
jgi:hypothetical protein